MATASVGGSAWPRGRYRQVTRPRLRSSRQTPSSPPKVPSKHVLDAQTASRDANPTTATAATLRQITWNVTSRRRHASAKHRPNGDPTASHDRTERGGAIAPETQETADHSQPMNMSSARSTRDKLASESEVPGHGVLVPYYDNVANGRSQYPTSAADSAPSRGVAEARTAAC